MSDRLKTALQRHEALVESGQITAFTAVIRGEGILIRPAGSQAAQEVRLVRETLASLRAFFHGVEAIEYGSFDYATLRGLVNASVDA